MSGQTIVPRYSVNGWTALWNPRYGYTFVRENESVWWPSNAAWMPGMPSVRPAMRRGMEFLPRQSTIERSRREHTVERPFRGTDDNHDGGTQGGGEIDIAPAKFQGAWSYHKLQQRAERHRVCAFHFETGLPLTRAEIGLADVYAPLRSTAFATVPEQLWPFVSFVNPLNQTASWQRYDPAHARRASIEAEAIAIETGDAQAISWLDMNAADSLLQLPLQTLTSGDYHSLGQMFLNVTAGPGRARIGEIRALAWHLRNVLNAHRFLPTPEYAQWIRTFAKVVRLAQHKTSGTFCDSTRDDGSPFQRMPWIEHGSASRVLSPDEGATQCFEDDYLVGNLGLAEELMREREFTEDVREIVRLWARRYETSTLVNGQLAKYLVTSKGGVLLDELREGIDPGVNQWAPQAIAVAQRFNVMPSRAEVAAA